MPAKDHFIERGIRKAEIDEYLANELKKAGYGKVDIQKTALGTRVIIHAARPGLVIGRRGRTVRDLTEALETKFGLENPQIEVNEIEKPELNARVMATRLASALERGIHFRRAAYSILRRVMAAGAKGVEIKISGKLTSQRARYQKFRDGFISKTGEPSIQFVDEAVAHALSKPGITGVHVKIMLPDSRLPDDIEILQPEEPYEAGVEGEVEVEEEHGA
ncbi:MAG: 30S ribosomal protein S3 [Candidatus Freyrarchaeum guaymaensis]|nr:30S ribosomal protein S3 [Candidatus Sigynarchaeota archaeon]HDO80324.1 30S ribosomal protein S3 [Candidatus Bathyarchaeota archaeon]